VVRVYALLLFVLPLTAFFAEQYSGNGCCCRNAYIINIDYASVIPAGPGIASIFRLPIRRWRRFFCDEDHGVKIGSSQHLVTASDHTCKVKMLQSVASLNDWIGKNCR